MDQRIELLPRGEWFFTIADKRLIASCWVAILEDGSRYRHSQAFEIECYGDDLDLIGQIDGAEMSTDAMHIDRDIAVDFAESIKGLKQAGEILKRVKPS